MEPNPLGTKQEPIHFDGDGIGSGELPFEAMKPEGITADWLSDVLGGAVGSIRQESIGDGLLGMNIRVTLIDAAPDLPNSVVVKLPSLDPTSRATGVALRNYEREVKFYSDVASTVDIRIPHCHHATWDESSGDFDVVLEDMAPAHQGDQITGCGVESAELAVVALAHLHGPRWNDPLLAGIEWLDRASGPDHGAQLGTLWQMFFAGFSETYRCYLTTEQFELAEQFGPVIPAWVDGRDGPETITHGDYRLDNMLFGVDAGGPPITVVDWQTPGHGSPAIDLSYFCGAGLLPSDRREHERQLVDMYATALTDHGVQVDETWLWEHYRRNAFAGVVMAVVASQVVGKSDRSEAMFAAMATRHLQHALELDSLSLV
jgi:hypothetical protein